MNQVRVYTPESSIKKPNVLIKEMWRDMKQGNELAWRLAIRDIRATYRQSMLGIVWAFLLPLANTLTWLFLRGSGVVAVGDTKIPYIVYIFAGTMLWAIFMESVQLPLQKVTASKAMMAKINFPREALVLSSIYQSLFTAGIKVVLLVVGLAILGHWSFGILPLLFPVGVLSLVLIGTTLGLFLTPIGLLYTDISKGLPIVLQFFMYLTPVVFPIPEEGWMALIVNLNPISPIIMASRDWLSNYPTDFLDSFLWLNFGFGLLFILVWIVFRVAMPMILERLSS